MAESSLTASQKERYRICTETIIKSLDAAFDGGIALIEVKDHKLYKDDFETFEEYCAETLKISARRAYQLIEAATVKESLPERASSKIINEAQARALASVPEKDRSKVISEASKNGPITAASIEDAAGKMCNFLHKEKPIESSQTSKTPARNGSPKPIIELDKIGRPIPDDLVMIWQDHLAQEILTHLSHARAALDKLMRDPPINWVEVNLSGTLIDLSKVWSAVEAAKPFALCPYCQGTNRKNCTRCKSWGFVSEFKWKTAVTKDLKEFTMKGIKK